MAEPSGPVLSAERILEVLARHGVDYVLIGGMAAVVHGAPIVTRDIDITPSTERSNLARLAAALSELDAKLRVDGLDYPVEFPLDEHTHDGFTSASWRTTFGDLDVSLRPDAPDGHFDYSRLMRRAVRKEAFDIEIHVAALDDVIASKEAAGRDRDLAMLPLLARLRERLSETRPDGGG